MFFLFARPTGSRKATAFPLIISLCSMPGQLPRQGDRKGSETSRPAGQASQQSKQTSQGQHSKASRASKPGSRAGKPAKQDRQAKQQEAQLNPLMPLIDVDAVHGSGARWPGTRDSPLGWAAMTRSLPCCSRLVFPEVRERGRVWGRTATKPANTTTRASSWRAITRPHPGRRLDLTRLVATALVFFTVFSYGWPSPA